MMLSERIAHFRATWKKGSMSPLMYRDADEIITLLEAENVRLREALDEVADAVRITEKDQRLMKIHEILRRAKAT